MGTKLLIVESPAKAKTIGKYLGSEFVVKSSVGHIRDLPKESSAIKIVPDGEKSWKFEPTYEVSEGKTKVVNELKTAVKASDEIYLASDPDREGEAIAWHLKEVLGKTAGDKPFHRVTYNEITKSAVLKAVAEPRDINMPRVDAQQARRILDRIVGYKVSPLLWKNINTANNRTLSAGRVQSVALRLLVERQREIDAFKPETYYLLGVEARKPGDDFTFLAKLARLDGEKPDIKSRDLADKVILDLSDAELKVSDLKVQPKVRHALPPFTTSTLQQAASSVLGFSPGRTMTIAQKLYENGHITYMRSDSVNVSEEARAAAKAFITANYGENFYPEKPNFFKSKASAQEAHEAIRPTHIEVTPKDIKLDATDLKLYDLIWRRFMASQMADAQTELKTISIKPQKPALAHDYLFTASCTEVKFEGFLKVMKLSLKKKKAGAEEEDDDSDEVTRLPEVKVEESLEAVRWVSDAKQTKGPAHFSEASLIKALEENGVGRPSTYAATIETLKARAYAKTESRKLIPQQRGILVCDWLVANMNQFFSVGFTAEMESELDKVEEQGEPMNTMLSQFYSQFLDSLPKPPPPPPNAKFEAVLGLLADVKTWKPAKKIGARTYDDCKFYLSCKDQYEKATRPMSARQLEFLVRMALAYSDQIPDFQSRLKEAGLTSSESAQSFKADPAILKLCFDTIDRIGWLTKNPFLKSLKEQVDRGRALSLKQFQILAREVGENCNGLPESSDIRAKLVEFVPGGFEKVDVDPTIPGLLALIKGMPEENWRPCVRKGKRVYDDRGFVESLDDQFTRSQSLSQRQVIALKRMIRAYKDKIPDYEAHAKELGLDLTYAQDEEKAHVKKDEEA